MIKRIDYEVDYITDIVEELDKESLTYFLGCYNDYVQEFYDAHDEGSTPVSIVEYFNNDFPIVLQERMPLTDFINDVEKMIDFLNSTKKEFLQQYSYLSEEEYDMTKEKFDKYRVVILADLYRKAENTYIEEMNGRDTGLNITSDEMKTIIVAYVNNRISLEECREFCDLCKIMGC